ncbi:hypothetical protein GGR32_001822 [Mesonia hippocampi]|uniref:Porin n=1 Tax=Mesonia hippocampi TaxID=1628250 RepID=A0A840ERC5_9FLAO|nr:porin [Mesonia hippocampi]MBB4119520.1 hypothetical protein [Mesonia hippocampi]
MKHFWKIFSVITLSNLQLLAQVDRIWQQQPELNISGFMDVFYVYDFNRPQHAERQSFLFNHNRHNEFNLNLALVKLDVKHSKYRANLALQTGTYAGDNYTAEPGLLKNVFEANIGISLNKKNNLWLDAGILPSHIGFESAISMNNLTLTRSLLAENSPYFLTGAKLTFSPNDKWEVAGLIVNGWQRIQKLEGNSLVSFGTQVNYKPTEKITLNWSTFIGADTPDHIRKIRYFNNLYGQFQVTEKLNLITGLDIGIEQKAKKSSSYNYWLSPVIIGQYTVNNTWKMAVRAEYYQDEKGVIIPTETINGFKTTGISFNIDYLPSKNISCRFEGRWLTSKDDFFETGNRTSKNNFIIGTSIAIKFSESLSN